MSQDPILPIILADVRSVTDALSTDEMVTLHIRIGLYHADASQMAGYEKVKRLFTEDDGRKMHAETRRAWEYLLSERLKHV